MDEWKPGMAMPHAHSDALMRALAGHPVPGIAPGIYAPLQAHARATVEAEGREDERLIEHIADGVAAYFTERTGFQTLDSDGRVGAYYGGHWIYLDPAKIATAALSAIRAWEGWE